MNDKRINVWIQKKKNTPNLQLEWFDPDTGRRKSKSSKTADSEQAEKARADLEYELNHGLADELSKMTWEKFREIYEAEKLDSSSENSRKKGIYVFDAFERISNPKTLGKITERTISHFSSGLRTEGRKPTTIKGYLAYIRAALRWAQTQGLIQKAPNVVMPKIPKGTNQSKIRVAARITEEEFERLLMKSPNDGWKLLIAFAWHCGMRRCEAMNVRGEDIDLDRHVISIPANKANDKDQTAIIPPELDTMLRETFPDGIPIGRVIEGVPNNEQKVSNTFYRKIASKAAVKGNGKGIIKRKHIDEDGNETIESSTGFCTLHDLRRAYGSRWTLKVPAQVLQRMMRHANISTTMEYYADAEKAAMQVIWGSNSST